MNDFNDIQAESISFEVSPHKITLVPSRQGFLAYSITGVTSEGFNFTITGTTANSEKLRELLKEASNTITVIFKPNQKRVNGE